MKKYDLEHLKTVLSAINNVRKQYESIVQTEFESNIQMGLPHSEAYGRALSSERSREAYDRLIAVYGCIGNQAETYIKAVS
jgi:predicted alpha/beta-fold hydrolase